MKRLFALFTAAAISIGASAATLLPIQLLNPAGSTSGQAIVSTGPSTAPAWGGIAVSSLTGLGTGVGTALATAVTGSGGIVLGTSPTVTTPNIVGVTNGSSASAGSLGENPTPGTGAAVSYTTNVPANCASITLSAGDWNVWGDIEFVSAGTTVLNSGFAGVSSTTGTLPGFPNEAGMNGLTLGAGSVFSIVAPMQVKNLSATTTIFLVGQTTFTTSTMTANCTIWAQRYH
jgi:hypothetical protein